MTVNTTRKMFQICFSVLNRTFPIMGFNVSMLQVLLFTLLGSLVLGFILNLFNKD